MRSGMIGQSLSLFCGLLLQNIAVSDERIGDTDEMEQIVTLASRTAEPVRLVSQSISTLTREQLALVSQNHIQEALLRVPGVNLQRGNGQEYLPAIRSPVLTGAGSCGAILAAEEGIPLRASGFCNVNELFEAHTEQATRIEVLRGPASVFYGSNALHGVVNVIGYDGHQGDYSRLGLEAGANDFGRAKLAFFQSADQYQWGGRATLSRDGGYRDQAGYKQQKLSLYHRLQNDQLQITSGLSVSNLNQQTAGFIIGQNAYLIPDIAKSNPTPEAYRDARSVRLWSRIHSDSGESGEWQITPYLRYTDMAFLQHFLPGDPLEENGQRSIGVQSAYYADWSDTLTGSLGVDAEYTEAWLRQTQNLPTRGSAFLIETVPTGRHYDYRVNGLMAALFAELSWAATEHVAVTTGVRLEQLQYDYDNLLLAGRTRDDGTACGFGGCRYSRPDDRQDRFVNLSPKVGVTYQLADSHSLYATAVHGFRAPQATEMYRLQRDQQVAELDSESALSVELGIRGKGNRWHYELALYQMDKDNVIFRDTDFFNRDNGKTEHRGVEIGLQYQLSPAIDIASNITIARHRYDYDQLLNGININGNDVDTAPHNFGALRLGWTLPADRRLELEWVHMGKYYLEPENLHQYPGHDLLNLRFSWQMQSGWRLHGRLLNLADKRYAERADFTSFTQERYFPGEPRSLFIGIEKNWK